MDEPLVEARKLRKAFGGIAVTNDVSLSIRQGEIHAVIGPNGAGKSTLIGQLSGELRPEAGVVLLGGSDVTAWPVAARARAGLARSFQITSVFPDFTVLENVALAVQATLPHSFRFWRKASRDRRLTDPARGALERIGLEARLKVPAAELSHGEQRQLELAMALATRPRVLLLDEPMAGMGPDESGRILALLGSLKSDYAILLVEHDMSAVFSLADVITVLVDGRVIACGSAAQIRANAEVRRAYLGDHESVERAALDVESLAGDCHR